jgi:LuxR family maltose regulon positive regulatory protein
VRALIDHLDQSVVSIVADAGYGKTTLLAETLQSLGRPVIWYSLMASDADPMVFARHLIEAFQREIPRFGRDLERALEETRPGASAAEMLGGILSNELGAVRGPEHVLVLDDFHEIAGSQGIVAMLDVVLRHPPDRLRVWIASRATPTLALDRLRARGSVFELDSSHLAFGREELRRLFGEVFAQPLTGADLDALIATTHGWPTAIQLVHQAMGRRPGTPLAEVLAEVGDAPREVHAYLSSEVVARLTPEARHLLERTVALDRFDPDLARALSGARDVRGELAELTHRGLLRSIGTASSQSFVWHDLVRQAVRASVVARDGEDAWRSIEADAALALRARGELELAMVHAVRARRTDLLVPLVRELAPVLLAQSRPAALLDAMQSLPADAFDDDPPLRIHRADASQALGRWDAAATDYQAVIDRAPAGVDRVTLGRALMGLARVLNRRGAHEQALGMVERGLGMARELPVELRVRLLQTKAGAHFYLGQLSTAVALLTEVRSLLQDAPHPDLLAPTVHNLALALVAQGRFGEAAQELRAALAEVKGTGSPRAGLYLANLSTVLTETGEFGEARTAAESALEVARRFSNRMHETMAQQALAQVLAQSGDVEAALPALKRAEELNAELRMELITADLLALRGRIFSARGQYRRAVGFFAKAVEVTARRPDAPRLTTFRAQLAWGELRSGRPQAARELLTAALPAADASEDEDQRMRVHYWLAETRLTMGEPAEALRHLRSALQLVKARGYEHFVRSQARENPAPLIHALANGVEIEVCAAALADAGPAVEAPVLALLDDASPSVAEAVAAILGEVGGRTAQTRLAEVSPRRKALAAAAAIARKRIEERLQRGRVAADEAAAGASGPARLYVFGPPALEVDGRRVPGGAWRTRRSFHVLVYLALHLRGAGRDELLETFWPGRQMASGRRNFHPTLSYLRTVLPRHGVQPLARDGESYRLDPEYPLSCDLWEFEALLDDARREKGEERRELLARALALADRPLLEGVYEDWADQAQAKIRDRVESAWLELGGFDLRAGRHEPALHAYRRAAEIDAYRETTRVAIVQCLVRLGNRAAALVEVERLREQLRRELGVEPLPETEQALREALGSEGQPARAKAGSRQAAS